MKINFSIVRMRTSTLLTTLFIVGVIEGLAVMKCMADWKGVMVLILTACAVFVLGKAIEEAIRRSFLAGNTSSATVRK